MSISGNGLIPETNSSIYTAQREISVLCIVFIFYERNEIRMSTFWPNPNYLFENNSCFLCGKTTSVKYFMRSKNGDAVPVCNKCVLKGEGNDDDCRKAD